MKITITASEAHDKCNWTKFCNMVGLDYYCLNNGMPSDREFELTLEQVLELGLIKQEQ